MYERKRDTLPNPGHDLAVRFGYFFVHILESRFTIQAQARTCKTKMQKNGRGILEIKSWLCEASNEIEQTSSSRKQAKALRDFSPPRGLQGVSRSKKDKPTRKECKMSKIVIFGAGNCGRLIAQNLLTQGEQILCFIDNDPLKANGTITLNGGGGGVIH